MLPIPKELMQALDILSELSKNVKETARELQLTREAVNKLAFLLKHLEITGERSDSEQPFDITVTAKPDVVINGFCEVCFAQGVPVYVFGPQHTRLCGPCRDFEIRQTHSSETR